jgi:predicted DNA-binding protein
MGREQINHEQMMARFPEGTLERIEAVLEDGEGKAAFIREAVETLLKKREKKGRRK